MAQGAGFKHITVTAADEDDVVIVAGAVDAETPMEEAPAVAQQPDEPAVANEQVAEAPATEAPAVEEQLGEEPAVEEQPSAPERAAAASAPASKSPVKAPRKDDYHETTLKDLENAPMPFAQRVVIIAAVVLIVIAVVYCAFFM